MIASHPKREDIRLDHVLSALGRPLRLAALRMIAQGGEHPCCDVLPQLRKSTMTHHFRILRDSGVVWTAGLALGTWAGGVGIDRGYGLTAPLWVGLAFALLGLLSLAPKRFRQSTPV